MAEQFVIADPHFGQQSMCTFTGKDGHPLRPFDTADEMDEAMVERWNAVVPAQGAKVYLLGDVVMKAKNLSILGRLNGKKKLIKGNHDLAKLKEYATYFYDIAAYRIMDGIIMSHIPIHEESLKERWKANVHGHLHDGRVMMDVERWESVEEDSGETAAHFCGRTVVPNPRYLCVSVEHTDYSPISMDEVNRRIAEQQQ